MDVHVAALVLLGPGATTAGRTAVQMSAAMRYVAAGGPMAQGRRRHGGIWAALRGGGVLDRMQRRMSWGRGG